ncbi:MAG TPA: TadE/TadG family type IV pilus assembly protein [Vicinamibacterales bacterium]|jgi:Flp pilus assembly protein TadG|nr:TadE/TadG family type IV pilus assembly protein [Vicinamibacterales bacterium]
MKRIRNQKGAALLETAVTIPLVLAVCVAIFEFGRAYQTWQVLTNAAREGARVSILAETSDAQVTSAVRAYMQSGQLPQYATAGVSVERTVPFGSNTASRITVTYPFNFTVLNPVMKLLNSGATAGKGTTTMTSTALMRNES